MLEFDTTAIDFQGDSATLAALATELRNSGYTGVIMGNASLYSPSLLKGSDPGSLEGLIIQLPHHPFEESVHWSATGKLQDLMAQGLPNPIPDLDALTVNAFSAWLLFAQSFTRCANEGLVTRDCVLEKGKSALNWTGGGLHAPTSPGDNTPPRCTMLLKVTDGEFRRLSPELGSDSDNGDGFACAPPVFTPPTPGTQR
ncbi:MAG TPA: hypothetical protein DEG43_04760 [Acidimicrobiaceae bacterium]|nr:hypothetical protein [Acidimicrobiaceae bacterium]